MTIDDVYSRLASIQKNRDDDERAHGMEDDLHVEVLEAIANGVDSPRTLAALALRSRRIKFARWCA